MESEDGAMKAIDIETLDDIAAALEKYLPLKEYYLYKEYVETCKRLKAEYAEKQEC